MDSKDGVYFETRKPRDSDNAYIRNSIHQADMDFAKLVEDVFGHHPAIFDAQHPLPPSSPSSQSLLSQSDLAVKFYTDCFVLPQLTQGIGGRELTVEEFLNAIFSTNVDRNRNNLFYLLGNVGAGKTAFINYLITLFGKRWIEQSMWFLRLDVYLLGQNKVVTPQQLLDGLLDKLFRIAAARKSILAFGERTTTSFECLQKARDEGKGEADALTNFVQTFRDESGKRLFLIVDNIDYIYHICDRVMFYKDREEDSSAIEGVAQIVRAFMHDGAGGVIGELGANVLFSLRPDSYHILRESMRLFRDPSLRFDRNAFGLIAPDWRSVFEGRKDLLNRVVSQIPKPGKQKVQESIVSAITADLEMQPAANEVNVIEHLVKLSKYGLRDVMDYFAQYSWLEGQGVNPRDERIGMIRILHSYPVALLALILGGHRRFNQFRSAFPNIYLVSVQDGDMYPISEHAHSYWLKRMILEFIRNEQRNDRIVRPNDVLNMFCSKDTPGYSEELVRACLGSMADANLSHLIKVSRKSVANNYRLPIEDITLTDRGQHSLEYVFDRFFYLQLIVDDYMLPVPRCLHGEFQIPTIDYSYFGLPPFEYRDKAKEMIHIKAAQVLFFLEILDVSLRCEERRYSVVFQRLQRSLGSSFPNVSKIRQGVERELERLGSNPVTAGLLSITALRQAIEKKRTLLIAELKNAYQVN
jgi:hypothetical protein